MSFSKITINFPLICNNVFIKKRCDVNKIDNVVEKFEKQKLEIPQITFDQFKYTLKKYREKSK